MRNIDKEITVNGKSALLYGFDWSCEKVIYRIAHDGGIAEYVEIEWLQQPVVEDDAVQCSF